MSPRSRGRTAFGIGCGLVGAALLFLAMCHGNDLQSGRYDSPDVATSRESSPELLPSLSAIQGTPREAGDGTQSAPMVRILLSRAGDVLDDAVVQVLALASGDRSAVVAAPVRTDESGFARFRLPEPVDEGDLYVEAVYVTPQCYSRTLVQLDLPAARSGAVQGVDLPVGGTLVVDLSSLPVDARPEYVELSYFPATRAHMDLVSQPPLPTPGVGLQRAFSKHLARVPVEESGLSTPVELPADHVVVPRVQLRQGGWLLATQEYTGPRMGRSWETPVLAIRAGVAEVYDSRWVRLPRLEIAVNDAGDGTSVQAAEVWVGTRPRDSSSRRFVHRLETGAAGRVHGHLKLGPALPGWALEGSSVVVVTTASGYRTSVSVLPFSWGTMRLELALIRDSGRTWVVEGDVSWPTGEPAKDVKLILTPASLRGSQFQAKTNSRGRFELRLAEDEAPLFFEGGPKSGLVHISPALTEERDSEGRVFRIGFGPDLEPAIVRLRDDASVHTRVSLVLERREIR